MVPLLFRLLSPECLDRPRAAGASLTISIATIVTGTGITNAPLPATDAALARLAGTDAALHPHLVVVTARSMANTMATLLDVVVILATHVAVVATNIVNGARLVGDAGLLLPLARIRTCLLQDQS